MEKQTLEEYISHVSHELRSPLAAIREAVSLIIDGYDKNDPSKRLKFLQMALDGTARIDQRIGEYLNPEKFRNLAF